MASDDTTNEGQILDALAEALGLNEPPSADTVDMIMTGYDIEHIDVLMAELVHDTAATGTLVPVREGDAGVRVVTYEGAEVRFDFEIRETEPQIVGRVIAAGTGTIHLDQVDNERSQQVDATGVFEFTLRRGIPFRLRFVPAEGQAIATGWID